MFNSPFCTQRDQTLRRLNSKDLLLPSCLLPFSCIICCAINSAFMFCILLENSVASPKNVALIYIFMLDKSENMPHTIFSLAATTSKSTSNDIVFYNLLFPSHSLLTISVAEAVIWCLKVPVFYSQEES